MRLIDIGITNDLISNFTFKLQDLQNSGNIEILSENDIRTLINNVREYMHAYMACELKVEQSEAIDTLYCIFDKYTLELSNDFKNLKLLSDNSSGLNKVKMKVHPISNPEVTKEFVESGSDIDSRLQQISMIKKTKETYAKFATEILAIIKVVY